MFLNFILGDMNLCFRPVLSILQSSFLFPNPLADFFSAKIRKTPNGVKMLLVVYKR